MLTANKMHTLEFRHTDAAARPDILPPLPTEAYKNISILLASNSPRRRELLGMIVPTFGIAQSREVEETYPATLTAEDVPAYLSQLKAKAYADLLEPDELLITADTVVILDGEILGKPKDKKEAVEMLRRLQGSTHTVVTGVSLTSLSGKKQDTFKELTKVTFGELSDKELETYVDYYSPLDKAGAYGIQEWIGGAAIERIDGCFYNVMGLPLHALYRRLKLFFA